MRWLLITSAPAPDCIDGTGLNPGDAWARMGVEKIIRMVDPDAVFDLLNKQDPVDCAREREFDKAVLCGMPLWWSHPEHECQDIHWWHSIIRGWPTARKRDFLVAGAGSICGTHLQSPAKFAGAVEEIIDRSWRVITRNTVIDDQRLVDSICPSAFTIENHLPKTERLVNLMPDGAHDPVLDPEAAELWTRLLPWVSALVQQLGFTFVAHSKSGLDLSTRLGWPPDRVFFSTEAADYLDLYARCSHYVGNRIHGATVTAAAGGRALAIGYDSRVHMAERVGARAVHPKQLHVDDFYSLLEADPGPELNSRCTVLKHEGIYLSVFKEFLQG